MSRYSIIQALYLSFFSQDLYRDVAKNWRGKTFFYLLVLIALSWIPFTLVMQLSLNRIYNRDADQIVDQIPVMKIENGEVTTPEARPYIIVKPGTDERLLMIDTTGQYKTLEEAKAALLITKNTIISQPRENESRVYTIPNTTNLQLDPQVINGYIKSYLPSIGLMLFIFFILGAYIYRIIQSLIYAIIGKIFTLIISFNLSYDAILHIVMVALTPSIILTTVLEFFAISFPHQSLIYFLLSIAYLIFGILANKPVTVNPDKNDQLN